MAKWTAPPTRREVTLVLFALAVFIVAFNLNASLQVVGLQPTASLKKFGLGSDPGLDVDGRRPPAFRDDLENLIVGDWKWEDGHVAGVESKQSKPPSKQWLQGSAVFEEFTKWGDERPASKLITHVPGLPLYQCIRVLAESISRIHDHRFTCHIQ